MKNPVYVMGHSEFELQRLERQDRLIGPSTRVYLQAAGIAPGMRVLDVGSGSGIVSFLAAELVGPTASRRRSRARRRRGACTRKRIVSRW